MNHSQKFMAYCRANAHDHNSGHVLLMVLIVGSERWTESDSDAYEVHGDAVRRCIGREVVREVYT